MANPVWTGAGANNLASTGLNWDTGIAPTTGDTVTLNGAFPVTGNKNCTWDVTATIASLNATGYSGLCTASAKLTSTGSITFPDGTFAHGSQTIEVTSTATITVGNNELYGLTLSGYVAYAFGGNITTNGTFTYSNYASITGGFTLYAKGDIVGSVSGSICDITTTTALSISICGSGNQNVNFSTDSGYPLRAPVDIASTGGTVYFTNHTHRLSKGLTKSSGSVDFTTNTSTVIYHQQSSAVSALAGTYHKLTFATYNGSTSYNTNLSGDITVNSDYAHGTSTTNVNGYVKLVGYTIYAKASVTLNDFCAPNNTTVLNINGTGSQAVDLRGGSSYYVDIPIVVSNSSSVTFSNNTSYTSGSITFNGSGAYDLGTATWNHKTGTITHTAGTIDPNTSTLNITASTSISTAGMSWYNVTMNGSLTLLAKIVLTHNWTKTSGTLSGNYAVEFNGTACTASGATAFFSLTVNASKTLHLTSGQTYSTNASGVFTMGSGATIDATTPTSRATLTVNGSHSVTAVTATDIDSSAGNRVSNPAGTNSNCLNWVLTAYTSNLTDSITCTESMPRSPSKVMSDAVVLASTLLNSPTKLLTDSATLSESFARLPSKVLADALTIAEVISKLTSRQVSDSMTLSETLVRSMLLVFTDAVTVSDSLLKSATRQFTDAVSLSEYFNRSIDRLLADALSLDDVDVTVSSLRFITLTDALALSEAINRSQAVNLVDTLALDELIVRLTAHILTDGVTLTESQIKQVQAVLSDALTASDSLSFARLITLSEILLLTENFDIAKFAVKMEAKSRGQTTIAKDSIGETVISKDSKI